MRIGPISPRLNANPLLGGLQLLAWFFLQPSLWRAYLQQIDPALQPHFCLAQLTDMHWQHPLLRRLLLYGYIVLPILSILIVGGALAISGQMTLLSMTGFLLGLAMGIMLGTAVSTATGVVAAIVGGTAFAIAWSGPGTLWFDLVTTPRFGVIYGVTYAPIAYTLLNIAQQRTRAPLSRQTGSFVIASLASIIMTAIVISVASVTFSVGEGGGLVNRSVGLMGAGITGGLFGLAVGWRTLSLRRGFTLGLFTGIIVFNLLGNTGNEYGHSLGGVLLIQNYSLIISLIFTLLFSLAYAFMERIAGTRPAAIAGYLGIIPIHLLLGSFMIMYDTRLNIAVSLLLSFSASRRRSGVRYFSILWMPR